MNEFSAEFGGVVMFGDGTNAGWIIESCVGAGSLGRFRGDRVEIPGRHGAVASGRDLLVSNTVEFELGYVDTPALAEEACVALAAAWAPRGDVAELTIRKAASERVLLGRPASVAVDDALLGVGAARARCVFEQLDPLSYAAVWQRVSLALAPLTGGFVTPLVTPLVTTTAGGARDASVVVEGSAATPWLLQIVASVPLVGAFLSFDGVPVVTIAGELPAGSVALLDSRTGSLTVDGYLRPVAFGSSWSALSPGGHTVSLRAQSGSASAELSWRDAFY